VQGSPTRQASRARPPGLRFGARLEEAFRDCGGSSGSGGRTARRPPARSAGGGEIRECRREPGPSVDQRLAGGPIPLPWIPGNGAKPDSRPTDASAGRLDEQDRAARQRTDGRGTAVGIRIRRLPSRAASTCNERVDPLRREARRRAVAADDDGAGDEGVLPGCQPEQIHRAATTNAHPELAWSERWKAPDHVDPKPGLEAPMIPARFRGREAFRRDLVEGLPVRTARAGGPERALSSIRSRSRRGEAARACRRNRSAQWCGG